MYTVTCNTGGSCLFLIVLTDNPWAVLDIRNSAEIDLPPESLSECQRKLLARPLKKCTTEPFHDTMSTRP